MSLWSPKKLSMHQRPVKWNKPQNPPPVSTCRSQFFPSMDIHSSEQPHEEQLHEVRVDKEELGSLVAFGPRIRLHGAAVAAGDFREKNIFE